MAKKKINLNCDMGESFGIWKMGFDKKIFPHIDMANLACGFHASDPINIEKSVKRAKKYDVEIGAHVAYNDLVGFGRRTILCSYDEIKAKVLYQLGALDGFCKAHNVKISYVKPHGALYNDMMQNKYIIQAILDAISSFNKKIKLMILSTPKNSDYKALAKEYGIKLLYEVFADRNYTDEGYLVPRTQKNAVIKNTDQVIKRIKELQKNSTITSINNTKLKLKADTICVHGDTKEALEFIKVLKKHIK
jgi:UPF0271 protein